MKKLFSLILSAALILSLTTPAFASVSPFSDLSASHWACEAVMEMVERGAVEGVGGGKFAPGRAVNSAEFLAIITRLFCADALARESAGGRWWTQNLETARKSGLVAGTAAGAAYRSGAWDAGQVTAAMSRYDAAQVLYNYMAAAGIAPSAAEIAAARAKVSDYAEVPVKYRAAVAASYAAGCLEGVGGGRFAGSATLTRAQAAMVLYRLVRLVESGTAASPGSPAPETPPSPSPSVPSAPETPNESAGSGGTLANGKAITDDNIREILYGLQSDYPEGMRWTNANFYQSTVLRWGGYGCEGFALICSDAVFGSLPISSRHSNFDAVKVGDMLRINNDTHTVVVLEKRQNSVIVAEGNYNSSIHWGREITRQSLESGNFTVRSRYPAN